MDFIDGLKERQARQGMTLDQFAKWLNARGVDASYLSRLYRGERRVCNGLMLAVMDKLPELSGDLFIFLRTELRGRTKTSAECVDATPHQPVSSGPKSNVARFNGANGRDGHKSREKAV